MGILKKIQDKPKNVRKVIFWIAVIIIGSIFLFSFAQIFKMRIENMKQKNIFEDWNLPELNEGVENMPKIETPKMPEFTEEELNALNEAEKQIQEENQKSLPQVTNP